MTHAAMSAQARVAAGIGDGLLRLSVDIEALADLGDDLRDALDRASKFDQGEFSNGASAVATIRAENSL